ncbi:MAG: hypothetical protein N2484_12520 [Clostridia bacterium]|nr:hypothetical protein [Clostridia bacterium]
MLKKVIIAVIIVFLCFLTVGILIIHFDVEHSSVESLLRKDPPTEFCIYLPNNSFPSDIVFSNRDILREFHTTVKDKTAVRSYTGKLANDKFVLTMDYGYKGETVYVTMDGSVFIWEDTADIRNKSRLHWLWWKLDGLIISKGKAHILYTTEPDVKVLELAKNIKDLVEKKGS